MTPPLRRRRDAADRLPPLDCGCRDPLTHMITATSTRSTYSLTTAELLRERRKLIGFGWSPAEVRLVLADPIPADQS